MNKEKLVDRLTELAKKIETNRGLFSQHVNFMEQLNSEFHALMGAKNECEKWLSLPLKDVSEVKDTQENAEELPPAA